MIIKYIVTGLYLPVQEIYKLTLKHRSLDSNQILFSSFPDFSDNSKALYEYMLQSSQYSNYHFVWLINDGEKVFPKDNRTSFVNMASKHHPGISLSALKAIATSKVLFYTHSSPLRRISEKKGQKVINLWHGCGYKERKTRVPKKKLFDFGLVPGPVFIDVKSKFWGCRRDQVIPIGYPRYDQMKSVSENTKDYFERLKCGCDKVIFWMPTYRKTKNNKYAVSKMTGYFELPIVDSVEQLQEVNEFCKKKNILLCVKRHPKQIRYMCEKDDFSNIKFISNQDLDNANADLYGLFACIDGLVTDYSSSAIDFFLMNKPLAFSLNDMEDYAKTQGFVFENPLKYMPGNHLYTMDDLLQYIDDICNEKDPYKNERNAIFEETHNPCDNYCERICNFVFDKEL